MTPATPMEFWLPIIFVIVPLIAIVVTVADRLEHGTWLWRKGLLRRK